MSKIDAHILVVDDNPATCYSTSRVLRSAGWKVSEAVTGREAVELTKLGPDLVVLDVNLPDIDGFEVCRRIRAMEAFTRTPVLHLSATFVEDSDKIHGLESGADGYLTHPIEPPVLIATVNAFLRARQAELAMRESDIRFKAVFDNAHNGIAILDQSHGFIEANPAMCQLLGRDCDRILGRKILDFVEEAKRPQIMNVLEELKASGTWRGNFPVISAKGEVVQLDWHLSSHTPGLWLAIVSDISDLIRYQEERESLLLREQTARSEAEHANQLKDEFLATLSHELRTPLHIITGWSRLLLMGGLDDDSIREGLDSIERSAQAQSTLISDLLDIARISSGKIHLDLVPLEPAEILETAIRGIQPTAEAKAIEVLVTLDPQAGQILGDASRLQQIFWNLLTNAIKFTPKHGRIEISSRRAESNVEICISDNGQGMTPETLTQIFERFRQADATSTREHGGLGLGLAIAKQLIELHGGSIQAESGGLDQGSTFTLTFPIMAVRTGSTILKEGSEAKREQRLSLSGVRILVVEDDPDSRSVLKRLLSAGGAESCEADRVDQALEFIPTFRPDVLISDLGMPHRDGFELIREVRARGYSHQDLPAIALTAFARPEDRQRSLGAGFQIHLGKPVDPEELIAAIARVTGREMTNHRLP